MFKLATSLILFLTHSSIFANENNEIDDLDTPSELHPDIDGLKALVPSEQMAHEAKWLIHALEKAHFNKISALDVNATIFLERFLRNLDRQKLFFSQQDLKKYNDRYSTTLITYLSQGNLFPAFEIFSDYRKKAITRLSQVSESRLVNLDLKSDLTYAPQRQDFEWAENDEKLHEIWIKLLTHELITESLVSSDINASEPLLEKEKNEKLVTARGEIFKKYARWKKNILEFEPSDIQELYLSTLTQMFDPHTSFLNVKEKEKFDQNMHNEFVGIGAVLTDNDGYCTIKELLPGGPAEASRALEPEDVILKVAQGESEFVNVVNMKLSKIVELIKGPENTLVRLEIRSIKDKSITKKVRIIREKIKLTANLASASIHLADFNNTETKIGVINLPSFYGSSGDGPKATEDVDQLITKLKKDRVEGIILDLRRNGGGYLSEAVNLAGLFISRGPVVQVKSVDGKIRKKFDFNPKLSWNKPLIVLTSRYSASASEIVAGALKDLKRAIIVGDSATHGKGTVQSLLPMNIPILSNLDQKKRSAAKITIQKYYLPSGNSTQIKGVESDISLPSINELLPIGESDLDNALSWDQISSVNYRRPDGEFYLHADMIDNLSSRSSSRQTKNPEFQYLQNSIELFMKRREQTYYSLNYSDRLNEILSDRNASSALDSQFEALETLSFQSKSIYLDVVNEQKEKSRAITGSKEDTHFNKFAKPESLDIKLHESIRIMTDWLRMLDMRQNQDNISSKI